MQSLRQDLRHGWRVFRRQPGLWILAVITLSIGSGVNGTLFTFAQALMQGTAVFDSERTVVVRTFHPEQGRGRVSAEDLVALQAQSRMLQDWVSYEQVSGTLGTHGAEVERVQYQRVSVNFLRATKAKLAQGRGFVPADYDPGQAPVAVISAGVWRRRFGSSPAAVGQQIRIDGVDHAVVGIAADDFWFPSVDTRLWVPARVTPTPGASERSVVAMATLVAGVTREQAKQELAAISLRLAAAQPASHSRVTLVPLELEEGLLTANDRTAVFLVRLLGLGILVIACANVANLLLVHALGRRRELALRTALGAGSLRLIRQMTIESLWLAVPATGLGLLMTSWLGEVLFRRIAANAGLPVPAEMLDGRVVAFSAVLAMLSLIVFSIPAAWQSRRLELAVAMRDGQAGAGTSGRSRWMARGFVVLQFGLAMALIVTAGIVTRAVLEFSRMDVGFPIDRLLVASAAPSAKRYATANETQAFYQRGIEAVRSLPGVASAGLIAIVPQLDGDGLDTAFAREAERGLPADRQRRGFLLPVGSGALETLGVARRSGRLIEPGDTATADKVVVANESAARVLGEAAIGERVCFLEASARDCYRVVGVVGDISRANLSRPPMPAFFVPASQMTRRNYQWLIRTRQDGGEVSGLIRTTLAAVDREEPIKLENVAEENYRDLEGSRLFSALVSVMGGLALFLSAVGLYCLLSYQVSQESREWGIRLALGARGADIQRQVAANGLRLLAIGTLPGVVIAYAIARLLSGMLPAGTAYNPLVWLGATVVLFGAGLGAVLRPAWRASRVDPVVALRND